jgi:hypothetical protein
MANTPKKIYVGIPGTSTSTLYTVPASTTTIVKNICLSNATSTAATITISLAGQGFVNSYLVQPNDTVVIDLSIVLSATDTIQASQGTTNACRAFISGVEVS